MNQSSVIGHTLLVRLYTRFGFVIVFNPPNNLYIWVSDYENNYNYIFVNFRLFLVDKHILFSLAERINENVTNYLCNENSMTEYIIRT